MIYNIPYSPQFNPIGHVNNELKRQIKTADINNKKRYYEKVYDLMGVLNY